MHELSIAMSLIEVATEEAQRRHGRVSALHLRLGELSGVVPRALDSAFKLAREGTALSKCRLVMEQIPVVIFCRNCDAEKAPESIQLLCCRECGNPAARVVGGRELELVALELEA